MSEFVFHSPRFAGDAVLEEILNDPDTGTKKLQAGSPANSVIKLQAALFALGWTRLIRQPVYDHDQFVIGVYGPITTRTVLTYKSKYNIYFPPDAESGFIDGAAGPRTLRRLDGHMVLFDEADAAIEVRAQEFLISLGAEFRFPTAFVAGTPGASRVHSGGGAVGVASPSAILYKRGVGAFLVRGDLFAAYVAQGGETGSLGFPLEDDRANGSGRSQRFELGEMHLEGGHVETTFIDDVDIRITVHPVIF